MARGRPRRGLRGPGRVRRGAGRRAGLFFAADPEARAAAEQLITAVGLTPAYVGDGSATETVDGLLPLWFALVQQNGGRRKLALRLLTEG